MFLKIVYIKQKTQSEYIYRWMGVRYIANPANSSMQYIKNINTMTLKCHHIISTHYTEV